MSPDAYILTIFAAFTYMAYCTVDMLDALGMFDAQEDKFLKVMKGANRSEEEGLP